MKKIFGDHDVKTIEQFDDVAMRAEHAALMADGHVGYVMPVGGVTAYRRKVSVVGVGVDIACGNAAGKTDVHLRDLGLDAGSIDANPYRFRANKNLNIIADEIWDRIHFGIGGHNPHFDAASHVRFFVEDPRWNAIPNTGYAQGHRTELREKAIRQAGTIGGGNHYVDVFVGEDGYLWVGVHFGSRGFGYTVSNAFVALSQGGRWGDKYKEREVLLDLDNPVGHDYWHLMELAGDYAYMCREWVVRFVAEEIIGAGVTDLVHNNHNFAWKEDHDGDEYVVVRKGATPAFPGQRGFVGGSMGDDAVILEGAETEDGSKEDWLQRQALRSTVHGAGRMFGRRAAKRRFDQDEMDGWLERRGVILRGADLDESPMAYRRLPDVVDAMGPTVRVTERLRPLIVCMAE